MPGRLPWFRLLLGPLVPARQDENARYQSVEAGLKADLKLAKEERALLRAENEKLATKVTITTKRDATTERCSYGKLAL